MAGHAFKVAVRPVDYKDGELSNLIRLGVFITSSIRPFLITTQFLFIMFSGIIEEFATVMIVRILICL